MRAFLLASFLLLVAPAVVQAQYLKMEVMYTDGHIISGPLTADLTELPEFVHASFLLNGSAAGFYATGDVLQSSLVFGDASWNAADLEEFSTTLLPGDSGDFFVTSLSYAFAPKNTPTGNGKLAANFPLVIEGTDVASGQPFHYQYDTSTQLVTLVPEPSTLTLAALSVLGLCGARRRAVGA
jgi:hypothetical protein